MSPDTVPLLAETYMLHLYTHPSHADGAATTCPNMIPKKQKDRLYVCPIEGKGIGWVVRY